MRDRPFADLPPTPREHFKLHLFAAISQVLEQARSSFESPAAALVHFPFLAGYQGELAARGLRELPSSAWWEEALRQWETGAAGHLPLRALREAAGLDRAALNLLMTVGLIEEDPRFGPLFETLQGATGQHRPTVGLLSAWWQPTSGGQGLRAALRRLQELGLVQVVNAEAPRTEWALQTPALLWDGLRGELPEAAAPWMRWRQAGALASLDELILPEALRESLPRLASLLEAGAVRAVVLRGHEHNSRRTLLGALAKGLRHGLLECTGFAKPDDERWRLIGPLAAVLDAMPAIVLDLAPGETATVPALDGYPGPIGIVAGKQGGIRGQAVEQAVSVHVPMPDAEARRRHWLGGFGDNPVEDLENISARFRMTAGNIRRAAGLARAEAALAGHSGITPGDVQAGCRGLNRQALDTLATRVGAAGHWGHLAVNPETQRELANLESRCRHRESLRQAVGGALAAQVNPGVRALFTGPSGAGKTLAARLLAAALHMDLYRVDLASVVSKYLGETEKSLHQVFSRAEELDVILLLDEGDALLTQRTSVQTSNDRYANLETNFLLQRLDEDFEGILIVTTNAGDRIDSAFERRMDVVVDFRAPEADERWAIWQMHLPADHAVATPLLQEIAGRCALTGGQIRNAVLHASLLALDDGKIVTSAQLQEAVAREYRKLGAVCPLRRRAV